MSFINDSYTNVYDLFYMYKLYLTYKTVVCTYTDFIIINILLY